jgi:hypothetical protein
MSVDTLLERETLTRLDLNDDPDLIIAACSSLMLDQMPTIVFDDRVLQEKIAKAPAAPKFASRAELDEFYANLYAGRLDENVDRLAGIFSNLKDRRGNSYVSTYGTAPEKFFGIEMDLGGDERMIDLGLHLDSRSNNDVLAIANNTVLAGEAELTAGSGFWLPKSGKYTEEYVDYFAPVKLGPGSMACFVLGGPETIRPTAHDFVTLSEEGRVICLQTLQCF